MSLLDRVRSTVSASRDAVETWRSPTETGRPWGYGALAVGLPWLVLVLLCSVVWTASPGSDTTWAQVIGFASGCWLLGTGATVTVDSVVVGISPILVWLLASAGTAYLLGRLVRRTGEAPLRLLPGFVGGYAAAAGLVVLTALAGPIRPTWAGLVGALFVPLFGIAAVLLREDKGLDHWLPPWARRAQPPVGWGVVALAGPASLAVLGMLIARWSTVTSVDAAVGAHGAGAVGLFIGQVLFAPDLVVWALSFIAGPGFQVTDGGLVSISGSAPGLLPMIPALGAVPPEAHYPAWVAFVLILPVGAGVVVGWQSQRQWTRLARWQDRCLTMLVAVATLGALVLGVGLLASGPVGSGRLAHVGPNPWALAVAVFGELTVGVLLVVAIGAAKRRWGR